MIGFRDLLVAAQGRLEERFPGENVYLDRAPAECARPAFLVEGGPVEVEDAGCGCVMVKATVKVTVLAEVDGQGNGHMDELVRNMAAVQTLFAAEGLRVEDRALHVVKNVGQYRLDGAEIMLTIQYQDDRPGQGQGQPLMGDVRVRM